MELQFKIVGILLIILACMHVVFPRYFNWGNELKTLSLVNSQMMVVHTFFIGLTVFLMGVLCLTLPAEMINTDLGKKISLGLSVFWFVRLFVQFFVYSSKLWKGKKFETLMHLLFTVLWVYLSAVFFLNYIA